MTTETTATVVTRTLKLDQVLRLPDQTRVKLTIEPIGERSEPQAAWESLKLRLRERPIHGLGRRLTREELHERR